MDDIGPSADATAGTEDMAALSVGVIDDSAAVTWDHFIESQPTGSFYHLYGWKGINEELLSHTCEYLGATRHDGSLVGALPLVLVASRLFGRILCSMPFVNYGGPAALNPWVSALLANHAAQRAEALGADYLELRCVSALATALPVSLRKVSMTVQLDRDPDKLWQSFSTKHRTNIRRAQKNDLEVVSGGIELLDTFYGVLEVSWRNLGTPLYSIDYFRRILAVFPAHTRIYICSSNGRPAAVALNGFLGDTVEGMWAGAVPELRHLQPNYVLYWQMLRDACVDGRSHFHLGRSTVGSGAEDFKSKWNAETRQLYWYFHRPDGGAMPELNVDNPKYRLAIAAWRRLPLWATRRLGPPIARLIP